MSINIFGEYQSQTTRQLTQISSSKYPDTNKDFEANIRRLNAFVDYIAEYLTIMQKGVDQANADVVTRIKDVASDLVILLGGGELLYGIDLGDLQYFLPALGALFGFDSDKPFPINLFEAAERFFLGYVVPLDAFALTILDIINGWGEAMNLDAEFMAALNDVMGELIDLGTTFGEIINNLFDLLDIFGIGTDGFGPFADIWHSITRLLGSFNLENLGNLVDPVLHGLAPWIKIIADAVDWLNQIVEAFSGGLADLEGILNFSQMFTPFIDFVGGAFEPVAAIVEWIVNALIPNGVIAKWSPLDAFNLFGTPPFDIFDLIPINSLGNAIANFLSNPVFASPDAIYNAVDWVWDGTQYADNGTSDPQGSIKTIANGYEHQVYSNPISVVDKQRVTLSIHTQYQDLVWTGSNPIQLLAVGYNSAGEEVSSTIVDSITPSGPNSPWVELEGEYAVSGEHEVRLSPRVDQLATAGTVWFSNAKLGKGLPERVIPLALVDGISELFDGIGEAIQEIVNILFEVIDGIPPIGGGFFADLFDLFNDWWLQFLDAQAQGDNNSGIISDIIDHAVRAWLGDESFIGGLIDDARLAMDKLFNDTAANTAALQAMQAKDSGDHAAGMIVSVDFSDYPDGPMPSIFTVDYTGPGSSQIVIHKGVAKWNKSNNANRDASIIYNVAPTETDFQILRGTMGSAPEDTTDGGRPHFYALGRHSSAAQIILDGGPCNVWARAWSVGSFFQYRCDIGCTVNGVEYVWETNIPLTWSMNMTFVVGVGVNRHQYQVWSGGKLVKTFTEAVGSVASYINLPTGLGAGDAGKAWIVEDQQKRYIWSGTAFPANGAGQPSSRHGEEYRRWGSLSQLRWDNGGVPNGPGSVKACAVADNELPLFSGTQAMMYRTSTSVAQFAGGGTVTDLPTNFMTHVGAQTLDFVDGVDTANGAFTVPKDGAYLINGRIKLSGTMTSSCDLIIKVNGVVAKWGEPLYPNNGDMALSGHWMLDLKAGDTVGLSTRHNGINVDRLTGEATGSQTFFDILKVA